MTVLLIIFTITSILEYCLWSTLCILKGSNRLGWPINYQAAVFHSTKEQSIADCQLFRPISPFLEKIKLFNKSLTRLSFLQCPASLCPLFHQMCVTRSLLQLSRCCAVWDVTLVFAQRSRMAKRGLASVRPISLQWMSHFQVGPFSVKLRACKIQTGF